MVLGKRPTVTWHSIFNLVRSATFLVLLSTLLPLGSAIAQDDDDDAEESYTVANSFDFQLLGGTLGRLQAHGNNLMGDMIDKKTGALTFEHTDVSIPGNSSIEVALRRKRTQGNPYYTPYQQGFADWVVDIPIAYFGYGYDGRTVDPVFNGGCITNPQVIGNGQTSGYDHWVHTDGVTLNVPGKGLSGFQAEASKAKLLDPKADWASGGRGTDYANRCAQIVIAPDGTRYKFGRHAFRNAKSVEIPVVVLKTYPNGEYESIIERTTINKKYAVYLITEVQDLHGNWVRYDYTNNDRAELTRIYSNDGRQINVNYNSTLPANTNSKRVSSVSAHGRSWRYNYGSNAELTLVTLPDGRTWDFDLNSDGKGMFAMRHEPFKQWDCAPTVLGLGSRRFDMKHPDGAIGTFTLLETRHIKSASGLGSSDDASDHEMVALEASRVPADRINAAVCYSGTSEPSDLPPIGMPFYQVMSLVEKTISGSDFTNATWTFDYRGYAGPSSRLNPSEHLDFLNKTWTEITEPDGTKRKYSYHAVGQDHGLLDRIDVTPSTGAGESIDYQYELSQQAPTDCYASGAYGDTTGACLLYAKRPVSKKIHNRDGVTYTTVNTFNKEAGFFIDRGRPSTITRYSSLDLNKKRKMQIDYWHSFRHASSQYANNNIIGLPLRVYRFDEANNRKEFVSYDYDDATGLRDYVNKFGVRWETYTYHSDGNLRTVKDPLGNTATLEQYYRGQPRKITRRDNSVLAREIDANGWVTSETDGNGNKTIYGYNDAGWMTKVDRPSPWADTTMVYQNVGQSNFYSNEVHGTKQTITWYDMMLRPTLERTRPTSGGGATAYTKTQYDALGRVVFTSLPSTSSNPPDGANTKYDGLGRVIELSENFGPNAKTKTQYLSANRVRVTDPRNNVTTTTRSGFGSPGDGEVTLIQQPQSVKTAMSYDNFGNIKTATQSGAGSSSTQIWSYDSRLRVCRHYVPETGSKLYEYDSLDRINVYAEGNAGSTGCLASSSWSASKVTSKYDELGRNTQLYFVFAGFSQNFISKTYDDNGNLKTIKDIVSSGFSPNSSTNTYYNNTWTYTYNELNQVETETLNVNGKSFLLDPEYNNMGVIDGLTYPSGRTVTYGLNGLGQTVSLDGYVTDVNYHSSGATDTITYGNGMTYTTELNDRLLPYDMDVKNADGDTLSDLRFSWDNNGNISQITDYVDSNYTVNMGYDGLDRLTSANGYWGNGSIVYDTLSNIKSKNLGSQRLAYNYDSRNRLDNVTGSKPYDFSYDVRGNVTNNNDRTFNYNLINELVSSQGIVYEYDGLGKRVVKAEDGEETYSVYGQNGTLYYRQMPNGDHVDYLYVNGRLVTTLESR